MVALTTKSLTALLTERSQLIARCETLINQVSRNTNFGNLRCDTSGTLALVLQALEASIARIDREIASLGDIQDAPSPQDTPEWPIAETATAASHGLSCGCANELCCTHLDA